MTYTKNIPFRGSATALVTPFKDGEVDYDALEKLILRQTEGGTAALIVCGTTGEAPTLTDGEYGSVICFAVETVGKRIPVIAGAGGASTRHVTRLGQIAATAGADALLGVNPYYNKGTEAGLVAHFRELSAVGLPVILYNVPGRTGTNIPLSVYRSLSDCDGIVGVKEASGDVRIGVSLAHELGDRYALYSGCDEVNLPLLAAGFDGFISVTANIVPEKMSLLWHLWKSGRFSEALSLDRELYPLTRSLFEEVNPVPVKRMLAQMGLCEGEMRLPLK